MISLKSSGAKPYWLVANYLPWVETEWTCKVTLQSDGYGVGARKALLRTSLFSNSDHSLVRGQWTMNHCLVIM